MQNWVESMSKSPKKPTIKVKILACLKSGEKSVAEIYKVVLGKEASIRAELSTLEKQGEIKKTDRGRYRLPTPSDAPAVTENLRGEAENTETINKMLNLYDKVLDTVSLTIEEKLSSATNIEDMTDLIKSLRWLGATVDQLMKRWYLVHRGYDSNTKQAQEDAKHKTAKREKQEMEQLPPEKQLEVVGDYDVEMRELLESLPEAIKKEVTV